MVTTIMHVYTLTEQEKQMVDAHRYRIKMDKQRKAKQDSCKHVWRYSGHSHNDDVYECTLCSKLKYE
jgi:muconolactone delta-isomerase